MGIPPPCISKGIKVVLCFCRKLRSPSMSTSPLRSLTTPLAVQPGPDVRARCALLLYDCPIFCRGAVFMVQPSMSKSLLRSLEPMDSTSQAPKFGGRRWRWSCHCHRRGLPSEAMVRMTCQRAGRRGGEWLLMIRRRIGFGVCCGRHGLRESGLSPPHPSR
eukprot:scaffold34347_cov118-Isochrysis_galbana.AAC.6